MSHVKPKKKTAKRKYRKPLGYDFTVLFIVLILVLFGVVMIFSSSYYYTMTTERFHNEMFYFLKRQSLWAVLGIVAMVGMMHIPYTLWRRFAKLAYWLSNLFLLALPFVGTEGSASRNRLHCPLSGQRQAGRSVGWGLVRFPFSLRNLRKLP